MSVIDKFGRKKLLLTGAVGTSLCLLAVAEVFSTGKHMELLIWLLVIYIAFFAFSQGAVIWVYLSEVFPNVVRAKGQSLGSFTHWIMNFAISLIFPVLAAKSGAIPIDIQCQFPTAPPVRCRDAAVDLHDACGGVGVDRRGR